MTTTVETYTNATGVDGSTSWQSEYEVENPLDWAIAFATPTGFMGGEISVNGDVSMDDDGVFFVHYVVKGVFSTLGGEPLSVYKVAEFDMRIGSEF